jgi:hypothetical protein
VTPEERARAAQAAALADFQAGRIANEFYPKQEEHGFTDADVERVLRSGSSGVGRYLTHHGASARFFAALRMTMWRGYILFQTRIS